MDGSEVVVVSAQWHHQAVRGGVCPGDQEKYRTDPGRSGRCHRLSRANARHALSTALKHKTPFGKRRGSPPADLWIRRADGFDQGLAAGRHALGKYLAATMDLWLPKLEAFGAIRNVRFSPEVREQLKKVSGATISRLLKPTRGGMAPKGLSVTKAGSELRSAIAVRRAGQEHEQVPGFLEADLVAHCGPALVGEFALTLTATDAFTAR